MSKFDEPLTVYTKQNWISDSKARPVTKRSLVQALSWSLDVVYCVLKRGTLSYLNSPSCNWVPAYAGVNMGWTSVLSRGSQWLSSDKHHGNPLHLIGGGLTLTEQNSYLEVIHHILGIKLALVDSFNALIGAQISTFKILKFILFTMQLLHYRSQQSP